MDNVMSLLQRYATNLETLVGERTVQLQEEKKKTETLLYEILPRYRRHFFQLLKFSKFHINTQTCCGTFDQRGKSRSRAV
jgi:hypothetical protein